MPWWSVLGGGRTAPPSPPTGGPDAARAADAPRPAAPAGHSPTDGVDAGRTDTSRRAAKPSRFSLSALGGSMIGRVGMGLATAAIVLGSMVGQPGALPRDAGVPLDRVEIVMPRGTLVRDVDHALTQVVKQVLPDASRGDVLRQVESVRLGVRLDDGIAAVDGEGLEVAAGSRVSVSVDRGGVTLRASPGATFAVDWRPDPTIHSIRYDFATATFDARASGPGPDGLYSDAVEARLAQDVQPLFPSAMRRAGYDPWKDPALGDNLQRLVDTFVQQGGQAGAASASAPAVSAPELSIAFSLPESRTVPLGDGANAVILEAGTRVDLSVSTRGAPGDLELREVEVRFGHHPLRVAPTSDPSSLLRRVEISGIRLSPGGQVSMDYELGAEQAIDGVRALGILFAIAAEPGLAQHVSTSTLAPTRLEAFRGTVQGMIDGDLEPQLLTLVRQNDRAIPGFSMVRFLGVDAGAAPAPPAR